MALGTYGTVQSASPFLRDSVPFSASSEMYIVLIVLNFMDRYQVESICFRRKTTFIAKSTVYKYI